MDFLTNLLSNDGMKILIIVIILDLILGILRAFKEKSLNSCIGIDGMIRKVAMMVVVIFLLLIDSIIKFNLIGFVPEAIRTATNIKEIGISGIFMFLFIIFEILSIFKNMILCKLPIPKKLQTYLNKLLKEFTTEIKEGSEDK